MAKKEPIRLIKQFTSIIQTKKVLFFLLLILLFLSVFWPKRNIAQEWQEKKETEEKVKKWEAVLRKYPRFRDIYLRLAILNWKIYHYKKANQYLQKAKQLDPNFKKTKEVQKIIQE